MIAVALSRVASRAMSFRLTIPAAGRGRHETPRAVIAERIGVRPGDLFRVVNDRPWRGFGPGALSLGGATCREDHERVAYVLDLLLDVDVAGLANRHVIARRGRHGGYVRGHSPPPPAVDFDLFGFEAD